MSLKIRASWGELGDLSAASQYYANNEQYYFQSGYQYPGYSDEFWRPHHLWIEPHFES